MLRTIFARIAAVTRISNVRLLRFYNFPDCQDAIL
jgi:hypothetical protein